MKLSKWPVFSEIVKMSVFQAYKFPQKWFHVKSLFFVFFYSSTWTREDLHLILSVGGCQYLYEKILQNGELDAKVVIGPVIKTPRRNSRWKVIDFESKLAFPLIPKALSVDAGFHFKESLDIKGKHSVEISGFFCHLDFSWNQSWMICRLKITMRF